MAAGNADTVDVTARTAPAVRTLLTGAVYTLIYVAVAALGQALVEPSGGTATLWPATGLAAGALYVQQARRWLAPLVGLLAGAFCANLLAGTDPFLAAAFAGPAAAAPALAAAAARALAGPPADLQPRFLVLARLAGATAVGCGLAALTGAAAAARAFGTEPLQAWISWWAADLTGTATLAPTGALLALRADRLARWREQVEAAQRALRDPQQQRVLMGVAALVVAGVASGALVFAAEPSTLGFRNALPATLPLAFALWLAWRFGTPALASVLAVGGTLAGWLTATGQGPFANPAAPPTDGVRGLQIFLVTGALLAGAATVTRLRELALRRSLADAAGWLRSILATASDAYVALDHSGRIVEWNATAERMFGRRRDQVLGQPLAGVLGDLPLEHAAQEGRAIERDVPGPLGARVPVALAVASGRGAIAYHLLLSDLRPVRALEGELGRVREIVENLRARLIDALRDRELLLREREALRRERDELRATREHLVETHRQLEANHRELGAHHSRLRDEHDKLAARAAEIERGSRELAAERDRLLAQLAAARHAHERARSELEQARARTAELDAQRASLAEQLANVAAARDANARKLALTETRAAELERSLADHERRQEQLRHELAAIERERDEALARCERLAELGERRSVELAKVHDELRTLASERDKLRGELARSEATSERLRAELDRLNAASAAERERLERAVARAERALLEQRSRLENAQAEVERSSGELERVRAQLSTVETRLAEERERHAATARALEERSHELERRSRELERARAESDRLASEVAAARLDAERKARRLEEIEPELERARRELAEADEVLQRWTASFERTRRAAALVDPDNGRVVACNQPFADLHGVRVEDIVGRPFASLATPRSAARAAQLDREVRTAGYVRWQGEHRHASGSVVEVAGEGFAIRGRDGRERYRVVWLDDLTLLRERERGARTAQARFEATFKHAPVPAVLVDRHGLVVATNDAFARTLGYPAEQLAGLALRTLATPDDTDRLADALAAAVSGENKRAQMRFVDAQGSELEAELSATALGEEAGGGALVWLQDASERRRFEGQLQHLTDHDGVTGLFNAKRFREELERELASAARYRSSAAVLAIDIDGFRYLNGALGHEAADELLARIADALRRRLRSSDIAARTGSDEFAVLLPRATLDEAHSAASGILEALRALGREELGGRPLQLTASIGAASFTGDPPLADELLVAAESALWDAKERGGDTVCTAAASGDGSAVARRLAWGERLRRALDSGRLRLVAQPLVALEPALPTRVELVVRVVGDDGELVPPAAFMPAAERFGLAGELDRWAIRAAVAELATRRRRGEHTTLELTLSASAVSDPELPAFVERELRAKGTDGRGLALLVPEAAAIATTDRARLLAKRLIELGVEAGLSEFGAGFGSFRALEHLPFGYVKIDRELVAGLAQSRTRQLVVRAIADLARALGRRCAAAGADEEAAAMLRAWGVDYVQPLAPFASGRATLAGPDYALGDAGAAGDDLRARSTKLF